MRFVGLPYTKRIGNPATAPKGQVLLRAQHSSHQSLDLALMRHGAPARTQRIPCYCLVIGTYE